MNCSDRKHKVDRLADKYFFPSFLKYVNILPESNYELRFWYISACNI